MIWKGIHGKHTISDVSCFEINTFGKKLAKNVAGLIQHNIQGFIKDFQGHKNSF